MTRSIAAAAWFVLVPALGLGSATRQFPAPPAADVTSGQSIQEEEDRQRHPPRPAGRHILSFLLPVAYWENAERLAPQPVDFVTEQAGAFKTEGYGFELAYHRRQGHWGRAGLFVGGAFTGYSHANESSFVGHNAVTGEPSRIKLQANWGYVAGSVRLAWRERRRTQTYAEAGLGLYLLRVKESLEDFGVADRNESDSTVGGYVNVGLLFPYKRSAFAVLLDGKVHFVGYEDLGGAFEDQRVRGPIYSFAVGVEWR